MILDITPVLRRIRESDFTHASQAKTCAVLGILESLRPWSGEADMLLGRLRRLREDCPGGLPRGEEYPISNNSLTDMPWEGLPLKERLLRLLSFHGTDIHSLSRGDDGKARRLLGGAEREFRRCREEAFAQSGSRTEDFLLYFHVLCAARPGYRHPANVRLYLEYGRVLDAIPVGGYNKESDPDSDLAWQYREVRWRRDLLREDSFDESLLPRLTLAEGNACEAFRLQCYRWMLDMDPENDGSTQQAERNRGFLSRGVRRLHAWLASKYSNGIMIAPETETIALMTLLCGINAGAYDRNFLYETEERAYALLDSLPASKARTRLAAHAAIAYDDPEFMEEAVEAVSTWDETQLTGEDRCLKELLEA